MIDEGILCDCGNLIMVEPVSIFVTLVFLCDPCKRQIHEEFLIPYD